MIERSREMVVDGCGERQRKRESESERGRRSSSEESDKRDKREMRDLIFVLSFWVLNPNI